MTTIDYTKYSVKSLLEVKTSINKEAYPENYAALLKEIENRGEEVKAYIEAEENRRFLLAEKRVKIIGAFQLLAAVILPIVFFTNVDNESKSSPIFYLIVIGVTLLNAFAGYTALKEMTKYYWVSITNQTMQLFSAAFGTIYFNYSGLGGVWAMFTWGEQAAGFKLNASFNPSFSLLFFDKPLPSGYMALDIMAVIFITALVTARERNS